MMHKAGLIGAGGISDIHFQGLAKTGRAKIEYVWDIDPANAELAASRFDCQTIESAQQLIDRDIDIVVISTPAFARLEYVELAAQAGKHILVEKPLALNLDDAIAVRDAVAHSGVTLMVGFSLGYEPAHVQLWRTQQSGRLGKTVCAWARVAAPTKPGKWQEVVESGHWRGSMDKSGGRIVEFGSHSVNWLLWVLGKPKTVYGKALYVTKGSPVDDTDMAIIDCEQGVATLEIHRHGATLAEESYGIVGQAGSVVARDNKLHFQPMDGRAEELLIEPADQSKHEHLLACIEHHQTPRTGLEDGIDTVRVCDAFKRSAASGRVEPVV